MTKLSKSKLNTLKTNKKLEAFSSGIFGKYDFLTDEDVLPKIGLLEKAATIKRFEKAD